MLIAVGSSVLAQKVQGIRHIAHSCTDTLIKKLFQIVFLSSIIFLVYFVSIGTDLLVLTRVFYAM